MQDLAWIISVWLMGLLAIIFIIVAKRASKKDTGSNNPQRAANKLRNVLFWLILVAGLPITMVTLSGLPHNAQSAKGAQIVNVEGSQFYWDINPTEIIANKPVEFHVTAIDATHGFAIYDSEMNLLTQTQAMPEYKSILKYTFTKPGIYQVLCLEYCGMGHHEMKSEFTVVKPGENTNE